MARKFKKSGKTISDKLKLLAQSMGDGRVKFDERLKFHTFSQSEGVAEAFYIATNQRELINALDMGLELKIPHFVIGNGSKVIISSKLQGLTIQNRTSFVKIAGVKGKISRDGLGVEEAYVEADSGVSLAKLNEFVKAQDLRQIEGFSSLNSTIGGVIIYDPQLREATLSLKVWDEGEQLEIKLPDLKRSQIVLSVILKFKSKS